MRSIGKALNPCARYCTLLYLMYASFFYDERFIKRGRPAELTDEGTAIEAMARAHAHTLRAVFDNTLNLPHMDIDMALEIVKELRKSKERYKQVRDDMQVLENELGECEELQLTKPC